MGLAMQIIENALLNLAIMIGIAWPAVFLLMIIDKVRGTSMGGFFRGGRYHLPKYVRHLSWHQHLIRLPLYCVFVPCFALCWLLIAPPFFVCHLGASLRMKLAGKTKSTRET
jgi:hypothetical protein